MRAMKTIAQRLARYVAIGLPLLCALPAQAETAALQHDNNGNVTQRTVSKGAVTQTTTYTYDALNRLQSEAGPAKTQPLITYDENGNRKSDVAGSYTYETTSNHMSTRQGLAVTFDAAGNLTADGSGKTFTYNQANQLYQVLQGSTLLATYTYDFTGLRIAKVTTASAPQGAQTVIYEYDEQEHIISEISGTGAPLRSYVWREDAPVAQIEYQPSRKILYFDPDHLNTPRAAMDETGKVVWRWESDAFGSTLPDEDPDKDGVKVTINLRFPGQYYDVESGLHYNGHRYYSPLLVIYTQADRLGLLRQAVNPIYAGYAEPVDLMKGLNQPFNYSSNNPIRFVDPRGLAVQICSKLWHPHTFICADGNCSGKYSSGGPFWSPGVIQEDSPNMSSASCSNVPAGKCNDKSFQQCVEKRINKRGPSGDNYNWLAANCGQWVEEVIIQCQNECEKK